MMMSSDTSWPASITFFAAMPISVPALMAARSMSPVEIWGMLYFSLMKFAWVPLPAPGAPNRMRRMKGFLIGVEDGHQFRNEGLTAEFDAYLTSLIRKLPQKQQQKPLRVGDRQ